MNCEGLAPKPLFTFLDLRQDFAGSRPMLIGKNPNRPNTHAKKSGRNRQCGLHAGAGNLTKIRNMRNGSGRGLELLNAGKELAPGLCHPRRTWKNLVCHSPGEFLSLLLQFGQARAAFPAAFQVIPDRAISSS
jgi:hypothetical protein